MNQRIVDLAAANGNKPVEEAVEQSDDDNDEADLVMNGTENVTHIPVLVVSAPEAIEDLVTEILEVLSMPDNVHIIFKSARLDHIALFITWTPMAVFYFLNASGSFPSNYVEGVASVLSTQYGTAVSIIFFMQSREVRRKWARLCRWHRLDNSLTEPLNADKADMDDADADADAWISE